MTLPYILVPLRFRVLWFVHRYGVIVFVAAFLGFLAGLLATLLASWATLLMGCTGGLFFGGAFAVVCCGLCMPRSHPKVTLFSHTDDAGRVLLYPHPAPFSKFAATDIDTSPILGGLYRMKRWMPAGKFTELVEAISTFHGDRKTWKEIQGCLLSFSEAYDDATSAAEKVKRLTSLEQCLANASFDSIAKEFQRLTSIDYISKERLEKEASYREAVARTNQHIQCMWVLVSLTAEVDGFLLHEEIGAVL